MAMSRAQMRQQVSKPPSKSKTPKGLTYYRKGGKASAKSKGSKICPEGKAWAKEVFIEAKPGYHAVSYQSIEEILE